MSDREQNAEVVREALRAFERRDVPALIEFLDPEAEIVVGPGLVNPGAWHGHAGFLEMAATWEEVWGEITYEATAVETPDDEHVLIHVMQRATGAQSGVPVELSVVYMVQLRDRKATRLQIHPDRESAAAAI